MARDDVEQSQTPVDIGRVLSGGAESLRSTTGIQVVIALSVFGLGSSVLGESLLVRLATDILGYVREHGDMSDPIVRETVIEFERGLADMGYGLGVSVAEILAALFVLAVVTEAVVIVAIRAFASADGLSTTGAIRRLPTATVSGFLGGITLWIVVSIGLALFVVPGIVIFVGTLFYRQEIAVADKGPVEALGGTWALTRGNRWTLLVLVIVLGVVGFVGWQVPQFVPGRAGTVLGAVVASVVAVFSVAAVTDAYVRLDAHTGIESE